MADADRGYFEWRSYANRLLRAISQWRRFLIWGEAVQPEPQECDTVLTCSVDPGYSNTLVATYANTDPNTGALSYTVTFADAYFDPVPKTKNPDPEVYRVPDQSARTDKRADRVAERDAFRAGYLSATYGGRLWDSWQVYKEGKNED